LGVTDALNNLLEPIRQEFANNPEFQQSFELAYPKPGGKKVKKVKDKGSRYPVAKTEDPAGGAESIAKVVDGPDVEKGVADGISKLKV
jgi:tyrosyl-tRNA synthetase